MMIRIALRQGRAGFIAATAIAAVNGFAQSLGYAAIAGDTPAARAAFAAQIELLGRQLTFLLPVPTQVETIAGFLQWRHFGTLPLVFGIWALLAASRGARGEEDRGQVELWLAAGIARSRYLLALVSSFALLVVISVAITCAATALGVTLARHTVPPDGVVLQGAALVMLTLCCYCIALAIAQLSATGRSAAAVGGAALGALFLIAGAARSGGLEALAPLSPFWQYERSRPLLSGGVLDGGSIAWLGGVGALALLGAAALFARRDLGSSALPRRISRAAAVRGPSRRLTLRTPVLNGLDRQASSLLGWALGFGALGFFLGSLLPTMIAVAKEVPLIRLMVLRGGPGDLEAAFVGTVWGSTALLLLSGYAITQVASWTADEVDGRLEMALSAPIQRWRIVLERAATLAVGTAVLVLVASAVLAFVTRAQGISVDLVRFAGASALLVPFVVALGAIGAVLIGWRQRVAVWVLSVVTVTSYFIQQLAPMFAFPDIVRNLSLFELYGSPLLLGPNWSGLATQLGVILVGFAAAAALMNGRDIAR